jgi:Putative peptidoglycan binding domain
MKRFLFCALALSICGLGSVSADETVRAVQKRLKEQGFYRGEENGVDDSATQAAVSRYQIHNGLSITGRLDAETINALGIAGAKRDVRTPKIGEDVWRYLRKSDQERILQMMADDSARARPGSASARTAASPSPPAEGETAQQENGGNTSSRAAANDLSAKDHERLRDYVGAFVLAGLDPRTGSELEFFAARVNYFGKPDQRREAIKRDLERYNRQWPDRRFWLAGDLKVEPQTDGRLIITFPLRYELRHGSKQASGQVEKTLVLQPAGEDLQIVAVDERKQATNR